MDDIIRQESTYIGTRLGAAAGSVIGLFITDQLSLWWIPMIFVLFYSIGSTAWFLMEKSYEAQREAQAASAERAIEERHEREPIRFNVRGQTMPLADAAGVVVDYGEPASLDEEGEI